MNAVIKFKRDSANANTLRRIGFTILENGFKYPVCDVPEYVRISAWPMIEEKDGVVRIKGNAYSIAFGASTDKMFSAFRAGNVTCMQGKGSRTDRDTGETESYQWYDISVSSDIGIWR